MPAILVEGSVATPDDERAARAGKVTILACGPEFWKLGSVSGSKPPASGSGPQTLDFVPPGSSEVVLNATLAADLGVHVGDDVMVRIGQSADIPAESALGRKHETIRSSRLRVSAIIPAAGLGRFGLRPNQQLPYNAYTDLQTLQDVLEEPDRANAVLIAGPSVQPAPSSTADQRLAGALHPQLTDYGLSLRAT